MVIVSPAPPDSVTFLISLRLVSKSTLAYQPVRFGRHAHGSAREPGLRLALDADELSAAGAARGVVVVADDDVRDVAVGGAEHDLLAAAVAGIGEAELGIAARGRRSAHR